MSLKHDIKAMDLDKHRRNYLMTFAEDWVFRLIDASLH